MMCENLGRSKPRQTTASKGENQYHLQHCYTGNPALTGVKPHTQNKSFHWFLLLNLLEVVFYQIPKIFITKYVFLNNNEQFIDEL